MKTKICLLFLFPFIFSKELIAQFPNLNALEIETDSMTIYALPALPIGTSVLSRNGEFVINGTGFWMSGKYDEGGYHLKEYATFSNVQGSYGTYNPGPIIDDTISHESIDNWNRYFTVSRAQVQEHITDYEDNWNVDLIVPQEILTWPGRKNPFFEEYYGFKLPNSPKGLLAPFIDRNNNDIYEPHLGDFPDIEGTRAWFSISNSLGLFNTIDYQPFEFHSLIYIDDSDECASKISYKSKIYYLGEFTMQDFHVGTWTLNGSIADINIQKEYMGFIPSEGLSFFYTDTSVSPNTSNSEKYALIFHQDVQGFKMKYGNNYYHCLALSGTMHDATEEEKVLHLLRGYHPRGGLLTHGGYGLNYGSTDTVRIMYSHDDNPEYGQWYDDEVEAGCNLAEGGYERSEKWPVASFGPTVLNKGDILDLQATAYYFPAEDWSTPSKERVVAQYDLVRGGCTDSLEWNVIDIPDEEVVLYPNPSSDFIYVFVAEKTINTIDVLRVDGDLVKSFSFSTANSSTPIKIDVSDLDAGYYNLSIGFTKGNPVVMAFVVI